MKQLLTIILIITISYKTHSQVYKTQPLTPNYKIQVDSIHTWASYLFGDFEKGMIELNIIDSSLKIWGDTLQAIKSTCLYLLKQQSMYYSLKTQYTTLIQAGVDFANNVNGTDKLNNCKWVHYNKLLNKAGWTSYTVPKSFKICKVVK